MAKAQSFRARAKEMKGDYETRVKEAHDRKEERIEFESIFLKDKIPKGIGFWRPEKGEHLIDVIPWFTGKDNPRNSAGEICHVMDIWVHRQVGPEGKPVVCPKRNWDQRCPVCEHMQKTRTYPEGLKAKRRTCYLVWVHDEEGKEEKKGVQLWEVAYYFFGNHVDEISKKPRGGGHVPYQDPDKGKSIHFKVKSSGSYIDGDGKKRESIEFTGHQFVDREAKIPDRILNKGFALDEAIRMRQSFKDIEKILDMSEDEEEDDYDDDETGAGDEEPDEDDVNGDEEPDEDEEAEEEEEEEGGDDLDNLSRAELKKLRTSEGLDFKVTASMSDDDIREKIRALRDEPEELDEEEEEPEDEDDGLDDLDRKALKKIRTDEGLDFKVTASMTDDDVRAKIREHRGTDTGGVGQTCIAGGTYGKDADEYEQCVDECQVYDDCNALSESG